jgi:hypothetical protein|nr:MAG TPA: hypothetical protein [Caudoviricetes sp.]
MELSGFKFWGAYSGAPLSIQLDNSEDETLKNAWSNEIVIAANFRVYENDTLNDKRVVITRNYVPNIVKSMNVDLTAIFKSLSFFYGDINDGTHIGSHPSSNIEISAQAQYYTPNREVNVLGEPVKKTFKIYNANFSLFDIFEEYHNMRICKRFYDHTFKVRRPYTTYFKGFEQRDYIVKVDSYSDFAPNSIRRSENAAYVDRVVDECGIFVTWLNEAGTWSYWLFSEKYTEEIRTKSLGAIQKSVKNDFNHSTMYSLGYTANKRWTLRSDVPVMEGELEELQSLYSSSVVFVYLEGKSNSEPYPKRVSVVEGAYKFDINKQDVYPFSVTIEFDALKLRTEI